MPNTLPKHEWRGASVEARQQYISRHLHINHPDFIKAANEIKRSMLRCQNEGKGAGILVLAPSGAGKTHLCRFLEKRWPDEETPTVSKKAVIRFQIPPYPTDRAMARAMLLGMGDPAWHQGNAQDVMARIATLLEKIQTKIVLVDDVQDIPDRRKTNGIRHIGNWIRTLIDTSKVLVVLLGTSAAKDIVYGNSQLKRRMTKRLHIDYFSIDTPGDLARFRRFILKLDEALPLAEATELSDDEIKAIHHATFGILDYVFQLFIEAVAAAVESGRERLDRTDFSRAFELVHQDAVSKKMNPFEPDAVMRPLTARDEPFFEWFDSSNPKLTKRLQEKRT